LTLNTWYHIAGTSSNINNGRYAIYINGTLIWLANGYVINSTLTSCNYEYKELDKFASKGIIQKLIDIVEHSFQRITYDYAIELVETHKKAILKKYSKELTLKDLPKWGDDLGSYCEKYISEVVFNKPTFVYNYPASLKSFYMKQNESSDPNKITVQGCDLLIPGLGELIGSSIREESYDKLTKIMTERKMDISKLDWYVDLRANSTFPHGGAGLGFDRLVNVCTLMDGNIRDVVPFPVAYQECSY
jgi:asparaginyl-tRNA synthetase